MRDYKFTLLLEGNLKHRLPEVSERRQLRLELCEIFGYQTKTKINNLNQRCKSGVEPSASQMKAMIKAFAKYGIRKDEIFDKDNGLKN